MNNGALILKSKNALNDSVMSIDLQSFVSRVEKDGGEIVDLNAVKEAIAFANNNGISSVNDAGIASPRWAIKRENGKVVRLYSLLNSNRDYVVYYRDGNAELNTSYGFNTLKLKPNNFANIVGREFDYKDSIISLNIHKPLPIPPEQLSATVNAFTIGNVRRSDSGDAESKGKLIIDSYHERASLSTAPESWDVRMAINSGTTYIPSQIRAALIKQDQSGFNTTAFYVSSEEFGVVRDGLTASVGVTTNIKPFEGTYQADYANRGITGGVSTHPLVADVVEVWTVTGCNLETAKALSLRAKQLYNP